MRRTPHLSLSLSLVCAALAVGCGEDESDPQTDTSSLTSELSFFVTSETNPTGNLGGLAGADAKCERLAAAVGAGAKTWKAYLSAANGTSPVHARERIGAGPWVNANGDTVATSLTDLHAKAGDSTLFVDENGDPINGQWVGSPMPVQHDVLTGSDPQGMLMAGMTCADWTSEDMALTAQVGHSDGLGPMQDATPPRNSWFSAHANGGCNDTAPRGGSGRTYCFASD